MHWEYALDSLQMGKLVVLFDIAYIVIFRLNMIMSISQKHWAYLGQGDIMIWYDIDKNDMMSLF